jgi:hypothetical protein
VAVVATQDFGSGGSPSAIVNQSVGTVTLSTSWTRYSVTFTLPSIAGKTLGTNNNDGVSVRLLLSAGTSVNNNQGIGIQNFTFDTWGHQWEAGSTATPFRRNANSLQGELAACQRYYYRNSSTATGARLGFGMQSSTTQADIVLYLPVPLRTPPSSVGFSGLVYSDNVNFNANVSAVTIAFTGTPQVVMLYMAIPSNGSALRPGTVSGVPNTGFLELSAEL